MSRAQEIIRRASAAAAAFRALDQKQTDAVVRAVYLAALDHRVELARMAHEETGLGVWQDKVVKNVIATQLVYEDIKNLRTVGVVSDNAGNGIVEVAQSIGPILAFIPVTNPTATTIFKILIAMKTRNPLIISPPGAARQCTAAAAAICYQVALQAGAPEDCIQCLEKTSAETINDIMSDHRLSLILATGTSSVVRKASRSGTPTIGVGPGNVPVYIGPTADVPFAVASIIASKTFDNGTVCASEQAVVVGQETAGPVIAEFTRQGAYFLSPDEIEKVGRVAYDREQRVMRATVVGQSVHRIAESAGISVPSDSKLLVARLDTVGPDTPLSAEILAPILAFYVEANADAAIQRCAEITRFGGVGHTAVIYSDRDEEIARFSRAVDASRILVNMPSTFGALGGMNNALHPSFTLSCGAGAHNTTTDNITVHHLLNIHRITRRHPNPRWMGTDKNHYLDESISAQQIEAEYNRKF